LDFSNLFEGTRFLFCFLLFGFGLILEKTEIRRPLWAQEFSFNPQARQDESLGGVQQYQQVSWEGYSRCILMVFLMWDFDGDILELNLGISPVRKR